jgi:hypothetical protein
MAAEMAWVAGPSAVGSKENTPEFSIQSLPDRAPTISQIHLVHSLLRYRETDVPQNTMMVTASRARTNPRRSPSGSPNSRPISTPLPNSMGGSSRKLSKGITANRPCGSP